MEGGGTELSYTSGIGSAQQFPEAAKVGASPSANRVTKTESPSVSAQDGFNGSSPVDTTELSTVSSAVRQALSGSDVRADKVLGLQKLIEAGTYNISASDVAMKVMDVLLH